MVEIYRVPLTDLQQEFELSAGQEVFIFRITWNAELSNWVFDLYAADENKTPLVLQMPVVTGVDLLAQYKFLGFDGGLFVVGIPTIDNLGTDSNLYYVVT